MTLEEQIKRLAKMIGFDACGIARAEAVDDSYVAAYRKWIETGCHAEMSYLDNYLDKKFDLRRLVEGAKSILVVAVNYFPSQKIASDSYQLAYYAYGDDYHYIIKQKLKTLLEQINSEIAPAEGRFFVDSAPVLERYWAWKAGLGWIGKSTQLILPKMGSYFFLGELIVDLELIPDTPMAGRCGSCTNCIDACPTNALSRPYHLNATQCLSYQTIEKRGVIDKEVTPFLENRIFGCDKCLQVCPYNQKALPLHLSELQTNADLLHLKKSDWQQMGRGEFNRLFKRSAVKRAGYKKIKQTIETLCSKEEAQKKNDAAE